MPRPVKWSRDLYPIREKAKRSRIETWSRKDVEALFGVGRATAQSLMKAMGDLQNVAGAHFVDRTSLLSFLDNMIEAPSVEEGLRLRMRDAEAPPAPKPLRVALPSGLRHVLVRDLPDNITLAAGRLEIVAETTLAMLESLALLAIAMQNDLAHAQAILEPTAAPKPRVEDEELRAFFVGLRGTH